MLYIGKHHMEAVVEPDHLMDCIEKAFGLYESNDFQMPDRLHVDRPQGTVLYMPCFTDHVSGTKIVSTFPENIKSGIPSIQGTMILNNSRTGEPLAIMDGAMITAYRTGAVGGVGVRHTTRESCRTAGLVGTGVQGFFQVVYACTARPIDCVHIYDRDAERAADFRHRLKEKLRGVEIVIARDTAELVKNSEIIITATPSTVPVLPDDPELLRGKHVIAIGSYKYEMRELPLALFQVVDQVYMDTASAARESGDLIVPMEKGWMTPGDYQVFGKVLDSLASRPKDEVRTTLFKSVGMALFDLLVAEAVYASAVQKGVGVDLGDQR